MHDVRQMILSVADTPLVACTPSYCALDAGGKIAVYAQHGTEHPWHRMVRW